MKFITSSLLILFTLNGYTQSWQDVGGGSNNSSHGMLVWDGKLVNLGSYNSPCARVSTWNGTNWECLGGGVGIVARAGCVWDNKLVVVGDFWNNFQPCVGCNGVAVWDGTSWSPLDNGFNNDVLTCTVYNGDLIIGGDFTETDGVPCSRVVRWNEVLGEFESLGTPADFDNDVRCMVEYDGDLWVGGDFNNVAGCSPCDGLVKWDEATQTWEGGNSGVDLVGGVNETVRVLYVNPNDGNLYMGGEFPELWDGDAATENYNMAGIAMYDGSNWYPLGTGLVDNTGLVPEPYVRAIHEYNGNLIIGGYFTEADGVPCNKIAKWNGSTFEAMGQGFDATGVDEYVKSAMVWNGIFFAGGAYTQAEGQPMNFIAQWYEAPTNPPTAAINPSSTAECAGSCIDFTDISTNSPTSWTWNFPGSSTPTSSTQHPSNICYPTAGTYTAELTACNANGCNTTNVNITIEDVPTLTVSNQTICEGNSATLTAVPSSGGGSFLWSPGGETTGSISVSPASTTTYDVQYSLNGCSSALVTATVTVEPVPTVSVNNAIICEGDLVTLTATPSTGGGSYLWSPGGETTSSIDVTPSSSTNYSVVYTLNGCSSSPGNSTVTVDPAFNSAENISACIGSNITYPDGTNETISGNTVHTSNMTTIAGCDSIITTNVTAISDYNGSENVSVCAGDSYTYPDGTVETIAGNTSHINLLTSMQGCDSTIVTNVTAVNPFTGSENVDVCEGSTYTYPDGTVETITINTSHTSSLTSSLGCDSTIVTNVNAVTAFNLSENISVCERSDYTYPDGTLSTDIQVDESHTSLLISSQGCDSVITTNITVIIGPDNTVSESGNVITANQTGATYQWLDCDNGNTLITGETGQSYTPVNNGYYAVEVTMNGCVDSSDCVEITTINNDNQDDFSFKIFPNPVKDDLYITSSNSLNNTYYEIFDAQGRVVLNGKLGQNAKIDVSGIERGTYVIRFKGTTQIRFVKE